MKRVVVLSGGVGGAKLVHGLALAEPDVELTAIINTGDDFRHLGLYISPDIDTVLYTLSGQADPVQGWGRRDETWKFMQASASLGVSDWFKLGDGDLALHVLRTSRLSAGESLSSITASFASAWAIRTRILPMSDTPVMTILDTDAGSLEFQDYFVARRCAPRVFCIRFHGAADAKPSSGLIEAIADADALFIAPSNPYLSVDPILAVPGVTDALRATRARRVAVSPLIGGRAVKGPTSKLMTELGLASNNAAVAAHYEGLVDALLVHNDDDGAGGLVIGRADTLMKNDEDRVRVARAALALAR